MVLYIVLQPFFFFFKNILAIVIHLLFDVLEVNLPCQNPKQTSKLLEILMVLSL